MRGRVGFRSVFAAGSPAAATGASAGSARAASPPIAEVTAATPLSGGDGWLVWSVQGPGGWGLEGYHDGTVRQLPVAPRPEPFDASVGSDSSGAPVVTFSRCKSTPAMRPAGGDTPGGELVEPLTGSGCRVHVLPLDGDDGRRSTLVDGEIGHEACTGIAGGEHVLETVDFEPPFVSGRTAWFGELYDFGCFTGFATVLMKHGEAPGYSSLGKLEGVSLAVAQDDGQLYGLVAPRGESWDATDGPYCTSASPCAIEPLGRPTLKREERPPFDPVAFYSEI